MADKDIDLSRRKVLGALGTVGAASVGAGVGTSAYFSDQETFENNQLTAGELDLKVSWERHYSDWSPDEGEGVTVQMFEDEGTGTQSDLPSGFTGLPTNDAWLIAVDDPDQFLANTTQGAFPDQDGDDLADSHPTDGDETVTTPCQELADVGPGEMETPVIEIADAKPGDFGEVTFDFSLCDNPGFVWLTGALQSASEDGLTEPEADDPDEDGDADATDPAAVELLDAVQAAVWVDDGDNYQDDEVITISGSLRTVLDELQSDPGLALGGNVDSGDQLGRNCFSHDQGDTGTADVHYVSFAWWLPVDHANEIQSDSVTFDLGLYTEQCRHNEGTGVDLERLVKEPEAQRLLTNLGHPAPSETTADNFGALGPVELRFDQARSRSIDVSESATPDDVSTIYTTIVPSPVGILEFTSAQGEHIHYPSFVFTKDAPDTIKSELDIGGEIGWPSGTQAVIFGGLNSGWVVRTVSESERSNIQSRIGATPAATLAVTYPEKGRYIAAVPGTPDSSITEIAAITESGSLVTDGGVTNQLDVPDTELFVLDPEFNIVESEIAPPIGGESAGVAATSSQCSADSIASCLFSSLAEILNVSAGLLKFCFDIAGKISDLSTGEKVFKVVASTFKKYGCILLLGGIIIPVSAIAFVYSKCVAPYIPCLTQPSPEPTPTGFQTDFDYADDPTTRGWTQIGDTDDSAFTENSELRASGARERFGNFQARFTHPIDVSLAEPFEVSFNGIRQQEQFFGIRLFLSTATDASNAWPPNSGLMTILRQRRLNDSLIRQFGPDGEGIDSTTIPTIPTDVVLRRESGDSGISVLFDDNPVTTITPQIEPQINYLTVQLEGAGHGIDRITARRLPDS